MASTDITNIVLQMLKDTQEHRKVAEAAEEKNPGDMVRMVQELRSSNK